MRTAAIVTLLLFGLLSVAMFFVYLYRENRSISDSHNVTLPTLSGSAKEFNLAKISGNGRPFVINVFASWCTTCLEEHATWKVVAEEAEFDLYGIAYVDVEHSTLAWLANHGNPYKIVAADYSGLMAKALGVTGVPETFVFDRNGSLVLHVSGVVTPELWKERISGLFT